MLFSPINLRKELIRERSRQQRLMNDVHDLLLAEADKERDIVQRLKNGRSLGTTSEMMFAGTEDEHIFHIKQIRNTCIRYRLRFLDSGHFKAEYPYDAIINIKALETKLGKPIESFHLIAPENAFELENINKDPLLFASLGNDRYYLLHQWGNDLAWYKRILSWPLQNFKTFFTSLWILSAIIAFLIPSSIMHVFSFSSEIYLRLWLTTHTFIILFGLSFWAGLTFEKTFSSLNWNSKYYNY